MAQLTVRAEMATEAGQTGDHICPPEIGQSAPDFALSSIEGQRGSLGLPGAASAALALAWDLLCTVPCGYVAAEAKLSRISEAEHRVPGDWTIVTGERSSRVSAVFRRPPAGVSVPVRPGLYCAPAVRVAQ